MTFVPCSETHVVIEGIGKKFYLFSVGSDTSDEAGLASVQTLHELVEGPCELTADSKPPLTLRRCRIFLPQLQRRGAQQRTVLRYLPVVQPLRVLIVEPGHFKQRLNAQKISTSSNVKTHSAKHTIKSIPNDEPKQKLNFYG